MNTVQLISAQFDVRAASYEDVYAKATTGNLWHHEKRRRAEWTLDWFAGHGSRRQNLRILDAGCGNGILACRLAMLPCVSHVMGVDLSERMVGEARLNAARFGVEHKTDFATGEMQTANGSFDAIIALGVLGYQASAIEATRRLALRLNPQGWLIATTGNPTSIPRWLRMFGGRIKRSFGKHRDLPYLPTSLSALGTSLESIGCRLVQHRSMSFGLGGWESRRGVEASRRWEDRVAATGRRSRWWAQTDWTVWEREGHTPRANRNEAAAP